MKQIGQQLKHKSNGRKHTRSKYNLFYIIHVQTLQASSGLQIMVLTPIIIYF